MSSSLQAPDEDLSYLQASRTKRVRRSVSLERQKLQEQQQAAAEEEEEEEEEEEGGV